jgi:hypothetical protein
MGERLGNNAGGRTCRLYDGNFNCVKEVKLSSFESLLENRETKLDENVRIVHIQADPTRGGEGAFAYENEAARRAILRDQIRHGGPITLYDHSGAYTRIDPKVFAGRWAFLRDLAGSILSVGGASLVAALSTCRFLPATVLAHAWLILIPLGILLHGLYLLFSIGN